MSLFIDERVYMWCADYEFCGKYKDSRNIDKVMKNSVNRQWSNESIALDVGRAYNNKWIM